MQLSLSLDDMGDTGRGTRILLLVAKAEKGYVLRTHSLLTGLVLPVRR